MPFVNEKLLRLVLVLVGLGTLGGFGWKMYGFVQNQDTIVRKLSMGKLEGTFGDTQSSRVDGHLMKFENYKVLQSLNITGYVPPPPKVEDPVIDKPKPRISEEDLEVPWIQAPTAAWIQGRGERAVDDIIPGDLRIIGEKFELKTKEGLELELVAIRPGEIEVKVVDSGKLLKVQSLAYTVDQARVFATAAGGTTGGTGTQDGDQASRFVPEQTEQVEPGIYAIGSEDAATLEGMSQEEILASVPVRVYRDPLSNEVRGLRIRQVPAGSVFSRLGIKVDDIVLEVNGQPAVDRDQLFESMRQLDTDILQVKIERLGGVRNLTFRLPR